MERQAILFRDDRPRLACGRCLTEHVLTMDIGNPAVMLAQVEHIAELARMPRINIQVLPAGRLHSGWRGAFSIAETGSPPAIVYLENASEGQTIEDPDMAESMGLLFDALRMEALTGSASLRPSRKRYSDGRNEPRRDHVAQVHLQRRNGVNCVEVGGGPAGRSA